MVDLGLRLFVYACCVFFVLWALYVLGAAGLAAARALRRTPAEPWRPLP